MVIFSAPGRTIISKRSPSQLGPVTTKVSDSSKRLLLTTIQQMNHNCHITIVVQV